ncbi:YigZ family protein [Salisediminibacterium selenitireducens]|uniref:Impact N-terminal domain-containing protein n=1 Tax=Bacillus selenitireducens (strain ATCC 700615 / DSM 15326 / MLS10) TaxID=439292 RepID=D6Y0E6_BACIE|nr:YigZ family protein [Salisediminibacterium selenitireducens]ADH98537.1 protein of unknown function UPF0029 [[Bacillus] selenitireducens MLS10]
MLATYKTVKGGSHEIVIQKSRFITYVNRAETEEEAQAFIAGIKKNHSDANHNCSAYQIGEHDQIQKANDDGEPSGTAGVPMLDVLKKQGLKDTVVVVTRYFGGIKLGGGGLIRAYSSSVSEALTATGIVECVLAHVVSATFDYTLLGKIENEIRSSSFQLKEIEYLEQVTLHAYVPYGELEAFQSWVDGLTSGKATVKNNGETYLERTVN